MTASPSPSVSPAPRRGRAGAGLALALLVLAVALAYADSFSGVFVFDDLPGILENPTLRHPGRLGAILAPPGDQAGTVGGRPLVNLSLAGNFAISGTRVWSYHAFNLAVHAAAALLLFGIVRRTLRGALRRPEGEAVALAFAAALLWAVHPLQTEAVTYVIQRAESLMGLFYLATLYGFIRGAEGSGRRWLWLSGLACLCGMATKEVMVSAPLIVWLYDRTFVAGSFREAWRRRRAYYLGLAATWGLLAVLVAGTQGRGGSAGFGSTAPWWPYLLTQCRAVPHYLRLAAWPSPLVFDYGTALARSPAAVLGPAAVLALLLAGTAWAVLRRTAVGFLGAWFFAILAPSSSFVPIATEAAAEHRMYLSLAAVTVAGAVGLRAALVRWAPRRAWVGFWSLTGLAAVGLGWATAARNRVYRSEIALWTDTARKAPGNARALNNLGVALGAAGEKARAAAEFAAAVEADPTCAPAQYDLGVTLLDSGHPAEALPHLRLALSGTLHQAELHLYLGETLSKLGRTAEAVVDDREALRLAPANLEAAFALGNDLAAEGHYDEAVEAYRRAVALAPQLALPRNNLANALLYAGRVEEAIAQYREILRRAPDNRTARDNLELALRIQASRQEAR